MELSVHLSENSSNCTEYWDVHVQTCVPLKDLPDYIWDYLKPEWHEILFMILFVFVFICGIIGNSLVCVVIWRHHEMRTVTNVFILNLAIADLLVLLLVLFPTMIQDIFESWLFTATGCKILKFIQRVSVMVSILTLTVISVERYYAISNPLKFKSTLKRARLIILGVWLTSVVTSIPDLYIYLSLPDETLPDGVTIFLHTCRSVKGIRWFYFYLVVFFIVPFVIITVSYIRIGRCLWSSSVREIISENSGAESQLAQRRKVARMLIAVVACFFGCYLPHYFGPIFIHIFGERIISVDAEYTMTTIGHLMVFVNSAANPIIYNFMSEKFRAGFLEVCRCCECQKKHGDNECSRREPLIKTPKCQYDTQIALTRNSNIPANQSPSEKHVADNISTIL